MTVLLRKILKKLKKIYVRIIPCNRQYRPNGLYKTIDDYVRSGKDAKASVIELYPGYVSHNNIPQEFLDKCTKTYLDLPAIASIPPARLVEIPGGRLYSDSVEHVSVISSDNKVIGEVTYQNKPSNNIEENVLLKQSCFIPIKNYKGVVFNMLVGGSGHTNYFHWLFDSIARLALLKKSGLYDKVDWFLVPANKIDYQKDSLRMLGIGEDKIIEGDNEIHLQADVLLATTYVRYHEHFPRWSCDFLRENFIRPELFTNLTTHPYVYISRKDANRRKILNEDELLRLLDNYGFKTYELTSLSFIEKVQLFYKAKVIVGIHGAGQSNLMFCNRGTEVIDMIPEGFVFPFFYEISNRVGVNYQYLILKSDKPGTKRIHHSNLIADLTEVRKMLDEIMVQKVVGVAKTPIAV